MAAHVIKMSTPGNGRFGPGECPMTRDLKDDEVLLPEATNMLKLEWVGPQDFICGS